MKKNLKNKNLSNQVIAHCNLCHYNLADADLSNTSFINVNLSGSNLDNANLSNAYISDSRMFTVDLSTVNTHNTEFDMCEIEYNIYLIGIVDTNEIKSIAQHVSAFKFMLSRGLDSFESLYFYDVEITEDSDIAKLSITTRHPYGCRVGTYGYELIRF